MNWDDYRLILALVRNKSVRGAARTLGISHATVSRRLTRLNKGPDGPLIQKSPTGLWPSNKGRAVFQSAEKMELIASESIRRQRAAEPNLSGPLCLSISTQVLKYILFDDVIAFSKRYPDIALTVDATDRFVDLDRAEADIVIRASHTPPEHWIGRRLFPYTLSFYAHKDYLATRNANEFEWISPPETTPRWQEWRSNSSYADAPIAITITNISGRFEALKRGLGLCRTACFMADPNPELVRLPGSPVFEAEPFWVLCHPDFSKTARAQAASRFFTDALQRKKALIQGDV